MNEALLASCYLQLCDHLLAIRKSGDWREYAPSFDYYVQRRWSLSKTRAKLLCDFSKFCAMSRDEFLRIPDAPENIKPILSLPHKEWMFTWKLVLSQNDGHINHKNCTAVMEFYGIGIRRRIPAEVLQGRKVRKAAKILAEIPDGEKVVEEIGVPALGGDWDMAVRVAIDMDQAKMDKRDS